MWPDSLTNDDPPEVPKDLEELTVPEGSRVMYMT